MGCEIKKAIINANIIDGTGKGIFSDGVVIIEGGKIKKVTSKDEINIPVEIKIIDAQGKYLLPGLIDAHVHVFHHGFVPHTVQGSNEALAGVIALKNLKSTLQMGVTTVRDVASGYVNLALRSAIESGLFTGPRILAAGRGICMTGGHGTEGINNFGTDVYEADGEMEIRRAIRKEVNAGVDLIKILTSHTQEYPEYTQEELNIAVEEAHRLGKRVACHAGNKVVTRMAAIAGVDTIEHGIDIDEETAKMMEEKDISLVPTLWVLNDIKRKTEERREKYKSINEYVIHKESMEGTLERYKMIIDKFPHTIEIIRKRNINIAAGTDNIRWYVPFAMLDKEMFYLTKYGFSNMEAIMAATSGGARALGMENQIGTIEENKYADLIMVENNPLESIKVFSNVVWVMREGEVIQQSKEWDRNPVFN